MGIPSYATAREMIALQRVDHSAMNYLIMQYCDNDHYENLGYQKSGNTLKIMRKIDYFAVRDRYTSKRRDYYFGKLIQQFMPILFRAYKAAADKRPPRKKRIPELEVDPFLNVMLHSGVDYGNARIILFEVAGYNNNTNAFIKELERKLVNHPDLQKRMTLIDMQPHLTKKHYYRLDDHLNAKGHARVADVLLQHID